MKKLNILKLFALTTIFAFPTLVQANSITPILPNAALKWFDATNLPAGAKLVILTGNPNKKEFYVARLKLPANYVVPIHSHLTNEYNTVISGTYYLGIGDSLDEKNVIKLPTGSFITFPAKAMHYGFTKEETILEISGIGPWGTTPRKLTNR